VRLLGNAKALGEAFHITADHAYPWSRIMSAMAQALGVEPKFVYVSTQTLVRYNPDWTGKLFGDKTWSTMFDNTKVKSVAGEFFCRITPEVGLQRVVKHYAKRSAAYKPDEQVNALVDRIAAEQEGLGGGVGG
jgi:nucleoside-diphosphate-sugar epimerase